ncbi:MAG: class I SAM-dependent methyltransferase [Solirubrobacteraceae bacterium]|nr:class I SAM-dependent methyltransferase [Solirubrobacteraceae bacterium]
MTTQSPSDTADWVALGHCPVCAATQRTAFWPHAQLSMWRCGDCRLVYTDPQPRGLVARRYLEQYDLADHFGARSNRKAVLYERRLDLIGPVPATNHRLCDVGCGDGQFLEMARAKGWAPSGIELNPPAAQRVRERDIEVFEGWFEELETLPWGAFDLVTSWDCLEHTAHPAEFATRIARLLRPGGTLALTTLNVEALVGRAFRGSWSMVVEDHYTYWNESSMRRLLADAGLTVDAYTTYGIGRDFVRLADAVSSRIPRRNAAQAPTPEHPAPERPPASSAGAAHSLWDARRPVLAAERVVNRMLERSAGGVGCTVLARKLAPPA